MQSTSWVILIVRYYLTTLKFCLQLLAVTQDYSIKLLILPSTITILIDEKIPYTSIVLGRLLSVILGPSYCDLKATLKMDLWDTHKLHIGSNGEPTLYIASKSTTTLSFSCKSLGIVNERLLKKQDTDSGKTLS